MARRFIRPSSQYLQVEKAIVTAAPFSMSLWYRPGVLDLAQTLFCIADSTSTTQVFATQILGTNVVRTMSTMSNFTSSTNIISTIGEWVHICSVWDLPNGFARQIYLNGTRTVGGNLVSPTGLNRTAIGRMADSTPDNYAGGEIGEVGVWSIPLSPDEVRRLHAGAPPPTVRPKELLMYDRLSPVVLATREKRLDFTNFGSTFCAAPPVTAVYSKFFGVGAAPPVTRRVFLVT